MIRYSMIGPYSRTARQGYGTPALLQKTVETIVPIAIRNIEGNDVHAPEEFLATQHGTITFTGTGGRVEIGPNCYAAQISLTVGDDCVVRVGANCRLNAMSIYTIRNSTVTIGEGCGFTWTCIMQCHESFNISMGQGCLIAGNSWITVSDMHSVIDLASNQRINPGADVDLGDRVWLGDGASIMKGVTVGSDSVIAARSVVTKDVPANSVAAGVPARVVRTGVKWDFSLLPVTTSPPSA